MSPWTARWGILATGGIAEKFVTDLLIPAASRGTKDVQHEIVAIASSASIGRANDFIHKTGCSSSTKAYGSYKELIADSNVSVIYVATPHSHHYQNVMQCLHGGKHVLCEKSFTVNAVQARRLYELAGEKKLFLMEAVWTRFFPLSVQIRETIQKGTIGAVMRVIADLSTGDDDAETKFGDHHRMTNIDLAGGVLLDLGVYSITWCFQTLYHTLPPSRQRPPRVVAAMDHYTGTGCDEQTSIILSFADGPGGNGPHPAQGIALTGLRVSSDPSDDGAAGPAIRIQGTRGEIQVFPPAYRPTRYRLILKKSPSQGSQVEDFRFDIPGHGMFWEADEVARCLRTGQVESQTMPWEESITIMEVMDEVRRQGGLRYPSKLETSDYPTNVGERKHAAGNDA